MSSHVKFNMSRDEAQRVEVVLRMLTEPGAPRATDKTMVEVHRRLARRMAIHRLPVLSKNEFLAGRA